MAFFRLRLSAEKSKSKIEIKADFRSSTFGFAAEKVKIKIEISLHTGIQCWFCDEKSKNKNRKPLKYLDSSLVFLLQK